LGGHKQGVFWRNFWVGWIWLVGKIVTKYGLVEQEKTERERRGGVPVQL